MPTREKAGANVDADAAAEEPFGLLALIFLLHCGVPDHDVHDVQELLSEGKADPNSCDEEGMSALMLACEYGLDGVAELLLFYGADPLYTATIDGVLQSPLLLAVRTGSILLVSMLLCAGASPAVHGQETVLAAVDERIQELDAEIAESASEPEALEQLAVDKACAQAVWRLMAGWFAAAQLLQQKAPGAGSVVVSSSSMVLDSPAIGMAKAM